MITKLKLYLAAAGVAALGFLVAYHKWVVARKKALEKELRATKGARKIEHKIAKDTAELKVEQADRREKVLVAKKQRRQGLGGGRRD